MSTTDPIRSVNVVGGGLAGFTVARELRSRGFDGALRIIDPQGQPYDRPPLSKAYLAGDTDATALRLAPDDWYHDNAVELVGGSVVELAPDRRRVVLSGGSEVDGDAVVLATGGDARRLAVPGRDLRGVTSLRTRADAEALRQAVRPGGRLVIVGAGLIGAEVAATAATAGAHVALVDPDPLPLVSAVGHELAETLHARHGDHGVRSMVGVPRIVTADGESLVVDVEQRDGTRERLDADVVLAAIGIETDTALADSAGLRVIDGIEVDARGATSHPRVWAAGDGVRLRRPDGTLGRRSEHWEAAMLTGIAAACGVLGEQPPERPPPWFWSDRYGAHVEAVGSMTATGSTVLREACDDRRLAFRVAADGTLLGCAAINGGKSVRAARRLIAGGTRVDPESLADPAVELRKLGARRRR